VDGWWVGGCGEKREAGCSAGGRSKLVAAKRTVPGGVIAGTERANGTRGRGVMPGWGARPGRLSTGCVGCMYDLVGDIHGHADALEAVLQKLGYRERAGVYGQPDRQVVFLGDLIDRGPQIGRVLEVVRRMVEAGSAIALLGNHELNALAFHTLRPGERDRWLRPRSNTNIRQHAQTLLQLPAAELKSALRWFRTLPLWLDLPGLRAVHACWDEQARLRVAGHRAYGPGELTDDFLWEACQAQGELFRDVERLLKGAELPLPEGWSYTDRDGHPRHAMRIRWYLPAEGQTYRSFAISDPIECDVPVADQQPDQALAYQPGERPVFFGHYWLRGPEPARLAPNVACLDYSIAKAGFLCAYRWDGEQELCNTRFVTSQPAGQNA